MPEPPVKALAKLPKSITREQARAVDRYAVETLGLPSIVLMENAAINATAMLLDLVSDAYELHPQQMRIAVCCGSGNNGGDGFAMARHLTNWGASVDVYSTGPINDLIGDAAVNARACAAMGLSIHPLNSATAQRMGDVCSDGRLLHAIVDALLGTGFDARGGRAALREPLDEVVPLLNALDLPVKMAVDVPSGLDANTGEAAQPDAFRATHTATFVLNKAGFEAKAALPYVGELRVADIGLSDAVIAAALGGA